MRRPGAVAVVRYHSVMDVLWFLCHHDIVGGGEDLEPVQLVHCTESHPHVERSLVVDQK